VRLHREVLGVLTAEIVAERPPAGRMLPRETDLAERFGISRGVARECIRALEERGLVRVRHGRGAVVTARSDWDIFDADVVVAILQAPLAADRLDDYLECREVIEVEAAGLAAARAQGPERRRLQDAFAALQDATSRPRASDADDRFRVAEGAFHAAILDAAGNDALARLGRRLAGALADARYPPARPRRSADRALPQQRAIVDAVLDRDPAAARAAMRAHLDSVDARLRTHARRVARGARGGS
jgi:GntR family transcriptional repressor for pyruvate dehydrogenase complex